MLNLNLLNLSVAANHNPPYIFMTNATDQGKTWSLYGGSEYRLLVVFSELFNFTYTIVNCGDEWGKALPNKSWTGLIGALVSGSVDLAISEISITYERSKVAQFSYPFTVTWVTYMTSSPKFKTNFEMIFNVFGPKVWLFCALVLMLLFFIIHLFSKYIRVLKRIHLNWSSVAALLNQPMTCRLPKNLSINILVYFWILTCLVLTKSYSQCLYSLMAVPLKSKTIDSIQELVEALRENKISVATDKSSSANELITNSEFDLYKEIGKSLVVSDNEEQVIEKLIQSKESIAFITVIEFLQYIGLLYGEQSFHLPQPSEESTFFLDFISIGYRKDFKYKQEFGLLLDRIKEGGFFYYWMNDESRKSAKNKTHKIIVYSNDFKDLNLPQIQSFFYLLIMGNIFAFIVLFLEIIFLIYFHKYFY